MEKPKHYTFSYSLRQNRLLPAEVVWFFLGLTAFVIILWMVFHFDLGLYLFLIYPFLLFICRLNLQMDFEKRIYRYAFSVLGFNFGKWNKLPEFEYISVFTNTYTAHGEDSDDTFTKIEINLIYPRNQKLNVWLGNGKEDAVEAAKYLSAGLNLKILDATTREFVWLEGYPE